MKGQTRAHSLLESILNVAIGYIISIITQIIVFPLFGINISFSQNMLLGLIFTIISMARSYLLRRLFNLITIGGI